MRDRQERAASLQETGAIGIIRVQTGCDLVGIVSALRAGGLSWVEITMNTPGALPALAECSRKFPDVVLGAGTVLDGACAAAAILAGAEFLVTPVVSPDVVQEGRSHGCTVVCGAMTPTEILAAWRSGADLVKVFPADVVGPAFFRAMRGPLPQIPLVPTGGITAETAREFIREGATAVCAGGWLVPGDAGTSGNYGQIAGRARQLLNAIEAGRSERR